MTQSFPVILDLLAGYLKGTIPGQEVVRVIDQFVSEDKVYELTEPLSKAVLDLQDQTALYVHDVTQRSEYPAYIGDDELRAIILRFVALYGSSEK